MLAPLRNQVLVSYLGQCLQFIFSTRLSWQGINIAFLCLCEAAQSQWYSFSNYAANYSSALQNLLEVLLQWMLSSDQKLPSLQVKLQTVYDCHRCQGFVAGCAMIFLHRITLFCNQLPSTSTCHVLVSILSQTVASSQTSTSLFHPVREE